jgi:hypothetical protein
MLIEIVFQESHHRSSSLLIILNIVEENLFILPTTTSQEKDQAQDRLLLEDQMQAVHRIHLQILLMFLVIPEEFFGTRDLDPDLDLEMVATINLPREEEIFHEMATESMMQEELQTFERSHHHRENFNATIVFLTALVLENLARLLIEIHPFLEVEIPRLVAVLPTEENLHSVEIEIQNHSPRTRVQGRGIRLKEILVLGG